MVELRDRLKKLGLAPAKDILPPLKPSKKPLEEFLGGKKVTNNQGDVIILERFHPYETSYGNLTLRKPETINEIIKFSGKHLSNIIPDNYVFIDTETTGLSGGTGTFPFLIGMGRFETTGFRTYQLLLENPIDELAQLAELSKLVFGFQGTVTFNGKSFDLPLLKTRFLLNKLEYPFELFSHIDLLHISRRMWKARLIDRSLKELEANIINLRRNADEVPGWMIPQIYFDYLRTGDGNLLKNVAYHNEIDIVSMAALLIKINYLLEETEFSENRDVIDIYSSAVMYAQIGESQKATFLFESCVLSKSLPDNLKSESHFKLAEIYKKSNQFELAIDHWIASTLYGNIEACIELSKYFEHKMTQPNEAIVWAKKASGLIEISPLPRYRKRKLLLELDVRYKRLIRSKHYVPEKD